jgi:glycosyltransferase involved in cell wall biosynthesis
MVNPGAVGLGILDSFASGKPLLTTACSTHGPEIEYLRPEHNGLLAEDSRGGFEKALIRLASDAGLRKRLSLAAAADSGRYSVEAMSQAFVAGVRGALAKQPLRFGPATVSATVKEPESGAQSDAARPDLTAQR